MFGHSENNGLKSNKCHPLEDGLADRVGGTYWGIWDFLRLGRSGWYLLIIGVDTSAFFFGDRDIYVIGEHLHFDDIVTGVERLSLDSEARLLIRR